MKYLKLFEDAQNDYEEIPYGQYFYPWRKREVQFTDYEISQINSIYKEIQFYPTLGKSRAKATTKGFYTEIEIGITKLEDEYFLVEMGVHYYKCDQLNGLINCIKIEAM